jgi:hypothetical protein
MAVPRPVLIALLGVALCAAAFLATRGASDDGGAVTSTPAPTQKPVTRSVKPDSPAKHASKPEAKKAAPADSKPKSAESKSAAPAEKKAEKPAPAPAKKAPAPTAAAQAEAAAAALARGDVAVFFFTRAGAADDTGTRGSVRALRGMKGVSIFRSGLEDLTVYRSILSGAGVSQVPAVVIVKSGQQARLLEGFVDAKTLRQAVADARR